MSMASGERCWPASRKTRGHTFDRRTYQQAPKILKQFFPVCLSAIVTPPPLKPVLVRSELSTWLLIDSGVGSGMSIIKGNAKAAAKIARMGLSMIQGSPACVHLPCNVNLGKNRTQNTREVSRIKQCGIGQHEFSTIRTRHSSSVLIRHSSSVASPRFPRTSTMHRAEREPFRERTAPA